MCALPRGSFGTLLHVLCKFSELICPCHKIVASSDSALRAPFTIAPRSAGGSRLLSPRHNSGPAQNDGCPAHCSLLTAHPCFPDTRRTCHSNSWPRLFATGSSFQAGGTLHRPAHSLVAPNAVNGLHIKPTELCRAGCRSWFSILCFFWGVLTMQMCVFIDFDARWQGTRCSSTVTITSARTAWSSRSVRVSHPQQRIKQTGAGHRSISIFK